MPPSARRAGLETLRDVLRRRNPGLDFAFREVEGDDLRGDTGSREISGGLTPPEDPNAALDGVDVFALPPRSAGEHAVHEAAEDLSPVGEVEI